MLELKVGADPELFVFKDGSPVSAHGMVNGDKEKPLPVKGGAVQVDGTALEFNIDPAITAEQFAENIDMVLAQLRGMIPGYDLQLVSSVHFPEEYFNSLPDVAVRLGCDPDFGAWANGKINPAPNQQSTTRTAAGHVHVGWSGGMATMDADLIGACCTLSKELDYYLGLPSLLFDPDTSRRKMYGKAGAFRPKPYGMEYRVLSNAWLKSPELIKWVFNNTKLAFERLTKEKPVHERAASQDMIVRDMINGKMKFDGAFIRHLCAIYNIPCPPIAA